MKNLNVIFNAILGVAVLGLYILYFTSIGSKNNPTENKKVEKAKERKEAVKKIKEKGGLNIAFVDVDSINNKYEFVKEARKDAETQTRILQAEFRKKQEKLQREIVLFQQTAKSMTLAEAKAKEQELMRKQQEFELEGQSRTNSVLKQEQELNRKIVENISDFIKRYAEENGYDYILTYSGAVAGTIYGNPGLDVTEEIIEGLNEEYKGEEKKEKKGKKK